MDFFKFNNELTPEQGRLLISEPFLPDPHFERTVVLLCEYNEIGSFGFVMNKLSNVTLDQLISDVTTPEIPVYVGGPVQHDTLHFIHRNPSIADSVEVAKGVYWGGDFELMLSMLDKGDMPLTDVKFFIGYSGWGAGQLEDELNANSWIVTPHVNATLAFDTATIDMWKNVLKELGGRFNVYSNYPIDPRLN